MYIDEHVLLRIRTQQVFRLRLCWYDACGFPRGLVFNRLVHTKGLKAEFGFESRRGKLQVSSMFACNYVVHAGHRDILGFSVSYLSIKTKFCREETIPWRTFLHPVWLLHTSTYMFAYILFTPNHIHVTCETCRSTYLRAGFFYDIHGQKWCPDISQPSHIHQFSRYNCLPPRIHPPWHLTQAQYPKSCWEYL